MERHSVVILATMGILAGLTIVIILASGTQAVDLDGQVTMGEYEHSTTYDQGRYELHWTVDGATIHLAMRAQTVGWVGFGLNPTEAMNNSDIIFGWVDSIGTVQVFDAYAIGPNGPHPVDTDQGGSNDITVFNGTEADGWTTIELQRLVNTGDVKDKPLIYYIPVIWAVGPDDTFETQHIRMGNGVFPGIGELKPVSVPAWVYAGEQVEVTYNLTLWGAYTYDMVTHTAVHWDVVSHAVPRVFNDYPFASNILQGDPMGDYMVSFTAPAAPSMVYMVLHAIIGGGHVYSTYEYSLEVREAPHIAFDTATGVVMAGRNATVGWMVHNAMASEVTHTAVHWDTVSHAPVMDFTAYPNAAMGMMGTTEGEYMADFAVPSAPASVYFIVHAIVNGRHIYNETERMIAVVAVPSVVPVSAPSAVLVGRTITLKWTVADADAAHITHTAVHWDTVSHEGLPFDAYPNAIAGTPTGNPGEYMAEMTAPTSAATVYYVMHAIVLGENFYAPGERTVAVRAEPTIAVTSYPSRALAGRNVTIGWTVSGAEAADVPHTAVHWDVETQGGAGPSAYLNMSEVLTGQEDGTYEVDITLPTAPVTVYFIAHAIVLGEDFWTEEGMMVAVGEPSLSIDVVPAKVLVGRDAMFKWTLGGVDAADITHTAVHWDTVSHAGGPFSAYPNALPGTAGTGAGEFMATMTAPATPTTVYYVIHAIVLGWHFYLDDEGTVQVLAVPTLDVVLGPSKAFVGATVTFRWNITGADAADVTHTAVHWDTVSHAGNLSVDLYPNALPGQSGGATSGYMAAMTAPDAATRVHYIFHAIVLGEDIYASGERMLDVRLVPVLKDVAFKAKVDAGKELKVTFRMENAPVADVTHVALHWDTTSHAGAMDYTAYPNAVSVTPNANGTYEVAFKVPKDKGTVYFVVHAIVDGVSYYATGEQSVKVEEADSPGFGAVLLVVALAAVAALSVGYRASRRQ